MGFKWLKRPIVRQQDKPLDGDAVCTIAVKPADHSAVSGKLSSARWARLLKGAQSQQSHVPMTPQLQHQLDLQLNLPVCTPTLLGISDLAALRLWEQLPGDTRRSLLLVSQAANAVFARCVSRLHINSSDLHRNKGCGQLSRLHEALPRLNELYLHLGSDFDCLAARHLRRSQLPLLHTLYIDSKLRGEAFHAVAKFIVACPNLRVLRLPNQRCSSATDQHVLATVLGVLPALTELDLGESVSVSSSGASNAITPSVMRRITHLRNLVSLSCNASLVPDSSLEGLVNLPYLQFLHISAAGPATGLAAAVAALTGLTNLEVEHPTMAGELVGSICRLKELQVLALGLCPKMTDSIMQEVCQLQQLQKVTVPFALGSSHLRLLCRLPDLQHLYSWRQIELDILGPAHNPLTQVQQLVCHSIHGRGKELGAWFPALESLVVKHCSDMAALSLKGCVGLQELLTAECGQLSDEGFACLKDCKGLQRLQLEGASQLTDDSLAAVFSKTMPVLQHINLAGCPGITDRGMQLLTGSCRRLANISLSSCRQLTDKTLKRVAHCEHLTVVTLKGCRGFTADGVLALAAAPQMKMVMVTGCSNVRSSMCKSHRRGVKVNIVDART